MTPSPQSRANVLGSADWLLLAALLPLHASLRLGWASGLGLGDDINLRTDIASIVHSGHVMASPKAYRVTWWLPTVLSARWFGLADVGLILPILVASTLGAGVLYALGTRLYGRAGGLIAVALLLVHPLDFAWSTMLTEDIVLSAASALAVLLALRALDADDVPTKRGRWFLAGVGACAAFYAKISAVFLAPAFLAVAWLRRDRASPSGCSRSCSPSACARASGRPTPPGRCSGSCARPGRSSRRCRGAPSGPTSTSTMRCCSGTWRTAGGARRPSAPPRPSAARRSRRSAPATSSRAAPASPTTAAATASPAPPSSIRRAGASSASGRRRPPDPPWWPEPLRLWERATPSR